MKKSRAPKLDLRRLNKDSIADKLRRRLHDLEDLRANQEIPTSYASLEALSLLVEGLAAGISASDAEAAFPDEWRQDRVAVPYVLIRAITDFWERYRDGPSGMSLGEAFHLEGGGQGSQPAKLKARRIFRERAIAAEVEIEYLAASESGSPISIEAAQRLIADELGVSEKTVARAHQRQKLRFRETARREGLIVQNEPRTS